MTCPKCESSMRSYERNGVTIDQCTGCRGLFLDRGELERLLDAEGGYYEQRGYKPPKREYHGAYHGKKKHRRESFLSDLLDF